MVILFTAPYYEEKGESPKGGFNTYLRRVTGALREMGHTPVIVSCGTRNMHYMDNGVEIFFVKSAHRQLGTNRVGVLYSTIYNSYILNKKISELVQERTIDVIQFSSMWAQALCYFGKTPAVMRLSIYSKVYSAFKQPRVENLKALLERLAVKRCNASFAPSCINARAFSQDIHRKVDVIESPFWNDCEVCDDKVYSEKLADKKYFLFFGRLVIDKGILVIAECLKEFLQLHPNYYFVCCGIDKTIDGRNPVDILRKAAGEYKDRVIFMKALSHNLLYPIIQHADFVIFPSLIDNFPNACVEAMYFERVVIGTDGTSFEQLIVDGKSGLLCTPGNAKSLLEKMNDAAKMDASQKKAMGRNAGKRIDRLAPEFVVNQLLRYYQYIIRNIGK